MCTFLAINTSSVQLIPMTVVGILAASGAKNPSAVIGTAFCATLCSAAAAIIAVKSLEKFPAFRTGFEGSAAPNEDLSTQEAVTTSKSSMLETTAPGALGLGGSIALLLYLACFGWFLVMLAFPNGTGTGQAVAGSQSGIVRVVNAISLVAIPFLLGFFPLYAALRRIAVYEEFVEGAKEGFQVAIRIIPFLVAMLVALGVFRSAGAVDLLTRILRPALDVVHFPPELVPISLMRPLSGSASLGFFSELVKQYGPDSLLARTAGTLYGSTETTFYVIAVYFGSVSVKRTRHAIPAGLIADAVGAISAVVICRLAFK
jgi:spore maturation protein SpmB